MSCIFQRLKTSLCVWQPYMTKHNKNDNQQKWMIHQTIDWTRFDWQRQIEMKKPILQAWMMMNIWISTRKKILHDIDVACNYRWPNQTFTFYFEIKMWIRPSREKVVEHREDSRTRYHNRMEDAQKRIEEKNIVLWDFVICTRRLDWIVQREWQFTWEIVKQYEYWNIRYYVEFERNWMKRTYPISIDEIKKA